MTQEQQIEECYILVRNYFKDQEKTRIWFSTGNPLLGGSEPMQMIMLGRAGKLLKFLRNTMEDSGVDVV